jgi:phospholipase C
MPNDLIKHIVVLMMENRSFDHLLGFMKSEDGTIRGVLGDDYSNTTTAGTMVPVTDGAAYQGRLFDPGHEFADVFFQMYGKPVGAVAGDPDMSGFAQNYEQQAGAGRGGDVMRCFRPAQLPVLSALARSYAVCDAWFSSIPGPTLPNRAFAHFGTSFGRLDMSPDYFRAQPSIYQRLRQAGKQGKIYYYDQASGTQGLTFLLSDQSKFFGLLGDFKRDCKKDTLPDYVFIEPNYKDHDGILACDQHPDNNVRAGDNFIREIYEAIRQNDKVWKSTVFLVVWDEHGGLFDHEIPPAVSHLDGFRSTSPPFAFDRLGVRVPAVVISPYVEAGTVDHTVYEHASIPATVTEQFIGDPQVNAPFAREKWAATYLHLLQDQPPRTDWPSFVAPVKVARSRTHALAARPAAPELSRPLSSLLRQQIDETFAELKRHYPKVAAALDPAVVATQQDAAAFMREAMTVLHPSPSRPARARTTNRRTSRRRHGK